MTAATTDIDWRTRGACRAGYDPDWWIAGVDEHINLTHLRWAIWVCRNRCPVRVACRQWAENHRRLARGAVYGGLYWTSRNTSTEARPLLNQPPPEQPPPGGTWPCGTQAAVSIHRRRGEPLDRACLDFDAARKLACRKAQVG